MKRTNILSLTGLAGLLVFILLTLFSCSDAISDSAVTESSKSPDGKTYIMLGESKISAERTIFPATGSSGDFAVSNLTDIILKGKLADAAGDEQTLATAETYSLIDSKLIPIEQAGNWTFTLTAKLRGAAFTGTATQEIALGSTNSISFTLSADENYGGMSIKLTFAGGSTDKSDYKVVATLQNEAKSSTIETKEFTSEEITPSSNATTNKTFYVTYERSAAPAADGVADTRLESGTYYLVFEIYSNILGGTEPLNTSRNFVRVENGLTTTAALSITLNEIYTIEYNDNEGTVASGGTKVLNYSPKGGVELPKMTPPETTQFFAGWYTDSAFAAGTKVSVVDGDKLMLAKDTSGNLTLYARYCNSNLYVDSENGQEGADGLSADTAVSTFASIISLLKDYATPLDWKIHIMGTLEGAQEISSEITTSHATSLAITGSDGSASLDAGGIGTTLTIGTAVPVTITNLKITGGNTSGNGGGISIASGATVKLGDGVVVSGNSAKNGGGVYNEGTLFMYGTAVIGDSNVESEAVSGDTSGTTTWSNRSNGGNGGGICSKKSTSSVYLGYSGFEEDGVTLVETELTGGVYHNYSTGDWTSGGGICIENSAKLYMDSGNICYNTAIGRPGGGVAAYSGDGDSTMFTMSGGSISHNKCDGYDDGTGSPEGGGGLRIGAAFTMSGGEICNNEAPVGAGISLDNGSITITGGSIKENVGTSANSINKESETEGTITINGTSYTESIAKNILNGTLAFGTKLSTEEKAVGDIVFTDGSAVAYAENLSLSDAQKGAAIAVIFYVGTDEATADTNTNILGRKTLGVGLKNTTTDLVWAPTTSFGYESVCADNQCKKSSSKTTGSVYYTFENLGGTDYFTGHFDGSTSWANIQEAETNSGKNDWRTEENYPAFYWVMKYTDTYHIPEDSTKMWYFPSVVELCCLYESKTTVSAALTAVGGDALTGYYWSCSQNETKQYEVLYVGLSDGYVSSDTKDLSKGVRAIRQF